MPLVHELIAARYFTRKHKDESLYSNVEVFSFRHLKNTTFAKPIAGLLYLYRQVYPRYHYQFIASC